MKVRIVCLGLQFPDVLARPCKIAGFLVGRGQIVLVSPIRGIDLVGGQEQRNRLSIFTGAEIESAQLMVGRKTTGSARESGTQPGFGLIPFLRAAGETRGAGP